MHILEYLSNYWLVVILAIFFLSLLLISVAIILKMLKIWFVAKSSTFSLTVVVREDLTDQLFTATLALQSNEILPSFYPGQYVTLEIPLDNNGTIRRAYSIANWDQDPTHYQLGIKREEKGKGSTWLFHQMKVGREIKVHPPKGDFYLPQTASGRLIFIAAGIGITPFRAMIQAITQNYLNESPSRVFLFHSCRQPGQLCYLQEFKELEKAFPYFTYIPIITGDDKDWHGERGRITIETIQKVISVFDNATFYLCAGFEMMQRLTDDLIASGVESSNIITESYGLSGLTTADRSYAVSYFEQDCQFDRQSSLFQAIEDAGLSIDGDCRSGSCGMCKCQLMKGEVTYLLKPHYPLIDNEILPCCCVPKTDVVMK